jgi:hypothetical protein
LDGGRMMKKLLYLATLCTIFTICASNAIEYPQFRSAVSTTGIAVNFDTLYQKADQLKMIHDVKENDSKHIIWAYKDTGSWAIVRDDGIIAVASPSAFSLDIKDALKGDLVRAKNLIESIEGTVSSAPLIYYVDEPYVNRVIKYDFQSDFNLKLSVPNCTVYKAKFSVPGPDYASHNQDTGKKTIVYGQNYYIDGTEISSCNKDKYHECGGICWEYLPSGLSCVPNICPSGEYCDEEIQISVIPVYITQYLTPGLHDISSMGIDNPHTMTIDAVTSTSTDEILLFTNDYQIVANETRSKSMSELYSLIMPINATVNSNDMNSTIDANA